MPHGYKILIVEDDVSMGDMIEMLLSSHQFRTLRAKDGIEGLRLARETRPSAVILDRMMPELDGHGVLKELKKDPALRKIPVLMLTAENRLHEVEESLALGALDYIVKPFDPDKFVDRVNKILFRHAQERD
jgi:two-component system phosphate regulon response regulator PhoB